MRPEVLEIALIAGAFTWAFRFFPTRADLGRLTPHGPLAKLLNALGPAAIAALFVTEVAPALSRPLASQGPLAAGTLATLAVWILTRSVVGAAIAGALGYGLAVALLG